MPIISKIGRKDPRVRLMLGMMYLVLLLGAVTMVYPFLLMASGSTKSSVDVKKIDFIPDYFTDDLALYRKHLEGLFNESVETMNTVYDGVARSFDTLVYPSVVMEGEVEAWRSFLTWPELGPEAWTLGYLKAGYSKTTPSALRQFKRSLQATYGTVEEANRLMGTDFPGWNEFFVNPENFITRSMMPVPSPMRKALWRFKSEAEVGLRYVFSIEGFYRRAYLQNQYGRTVEGYNQTHGTAYEDYNAIPLTRVFPEDAGQQAQADWESFVRDMLNPIWISVHQQERPVWINYLKARYGKVEKLNSQHGVSFNSWAEVLLPSTPARSGLELTDWNALLQGWADPETKETYRFDVKSLSLSGPDFAWRYHLYRTFGSVDAMNKALGTDHVDLRTIQMPQQAFHLIEFLDARKTLRWEFTTRNYQAVLDYMLFHGRGIINTVIYCGLAVLFALLVNPLAAYAMSRYQMPATYKILLFLLLTMAFPPMVTQIPSFLMLRQMNLLNTFAALILPGLAHGYSIFLLKGFFDSLPRDLYESAQIDGASEWTMFWLITMSLSKPILAVIALQAFTLAYSNFMFALLICQDEKMWTLMVWLYELQQKSGQGVIYASLMIAAIPTFLIFAVCQNIILRGIVVPVEK